jgi:hypothetical protein
MELGVCCLFPLFSLCQSFSLPLPILRLGLESNAV